MHTRIRALGRVQTAIDHTKVGDIVVLCRNAPPTDARGRVQDELNALIEGENGSLAEIDRLQSEFADYQKEYDGRSRFVVRLRTCPPPPLVS
jgi:hypothetical protein